MEKMVRGRLQPWAPPWALTALLPGCASHSAQKGRPEKGQAARCNLPGLRTTVLAFVPFPAARSFCGSGI